MKHVSHSPRLALVAVFASTLIWGGAGHTAQADETKIKVDSPSSDQDTSILIHKGPSKDTGFNSSTEYRIVEESEEIAGEPAVDRQASYESWKKACADWKKALKEDHGKNLLSANCGRPRLDRDAVTFQITQTSGATYKIKTAINEPNRN